MNADQKTAIEALSKERGVNANDAIVGNGTRAGYVLGHPNVVPSSETVTVDGSSKRRNRDYYLDCINGTLMFLDAVRPSQMIRVTYRYVPGKEGERAIVGTPTMALNIGRNAALGITYAYRTGMSVGQNSQYDLLTFGANLKTALGANSNMTNMFYTSSPKQSGRVSLQALQDGAKQAAEAPKADRMFLHNSSLSFGKLSIKTDFQKVGQDFTGFASLRDQNAAPLDVLNRLEKEKGITRLGINAALDLGGGASTGLDWKTIGDKGGDIVLGSLNLASKNYGLTVSQSKVEEGFKRLGSLSPDDLRDIALRIRREFDPNAAAGSVTKEDLEHAARETGIERMNIAGNLKLASGIASLQMVSLGDGSSGLSRQSFGIQGEGFSLSGLFQQIDQDFKKLGMLSPTEKATFGNEYGMDRMNLAGALSLGSGMNVASSFARVGDDNGDVVKYGLSLKGSKLDLNAHYQSIDPEFTRIMDLADADREAMMAEQGMKRYDAALNYQMNKALSLQSFWYDAQHATQDKFKRQLRNQLTYNPASGPRIILFRYQDQAGASDAFGTFLHEAYKLDDKIKLSAIGPIEFKGLMDIQTTTAADGTDQQVKVSTYHVQNDRKQRVRFTGDVNSVERSDDTFEKAQVFTLGTKLTPTLAFHGMRRTINTQSDQTVAQDYGITGKVLGGYALSARFGETLLNGATVGKIRELSLTPPAARDFGIFKGVNWNLKFAEVRNRDKIETGTKQASLDSTVLRHRIALAYSGLITKEGQTPIVRSFSVLGDPNPANKLHYALAYKVIDPRAARSMLVRNYTAEYKFNATTVLNYLYMSYNEKDGKFEPIGIERLKLTTTLTKALSLIGHWENAENYQAGTDRTQMSLGIAGKLDSLTAVEVSYGYDRVVTPGGETTASTYKVKYDQTISADHFLTFSGTYTDWNGPKPSNANADDVTLQLDFNLLFD